MRHDAIDRPSPVLVRVPRRPAAERAGQPLLTMLVPLAAGAILWAMTGSPFALVLGAVGPLAAVLGPVLGRAGGRRRAARRERAELLERLEQWARRQVAAHADLLRLAHPSASALCASLREGAPLRTSASGDGAVLVVGEGARACTVDAAAPGDDDDETRDEARMIAERGAGLIGVPILAEASRGIAIVGPPARSRAFARSLVVQAAAASGSWSVAVEGCREAWSWLGPALVPAADAGIRVIDGSRGDAVRTDGGDIVARILLVSSRRDVPASYRVLVDLGAPVARLHHPEPRWDGELEIDAISAQDAATCFRALTVGASPSSIPIPAQALTRDLPLVQHGAVARSTGLAVPIGLGGGGLVTEIDLIGDGPHALVAGATGSGKSELLLTWILAMAEVAPPSQLAFLLVDFKGGATFAQMSRLPHCVGIVTDLDDGAERAMRSLGAELRRRERLLGENGARDWSELPESVELPRLVVAVDEFTAVIGAHGGLADLFADIAARGRSLGIHLILCAQRPSGAFRDAIAVNCPLRLCLRVRSAPDAHLMCGASQSDALAQAPDGRACIASDSGVVWCQVAREEEVRARVDRLRSRTSSAARLWLDPLPSALPLRLLAPPAAGGIAVGRFDLPEEQSQPQADLVPHRDGALLVLGGARSGRSSLLALTARQSGASVIGPADLEAAWDAVHDPVAGPLLVDDLDLIVGLLGDDYALAWCQALEGVLRGSARDGRLAICTATRTPSLLSPAIAAFGSTLELRQPAEQGRVSAAGRRDSTLSPGAGWWKERRVQCAVLEEGPALEARVSRCRTVDAEELAAMRPAVVSGRPWQFSSDSGIEIATALASWDAGEDDGRIPLADPVVWQSRPSLLAAVRAERPLLFHRCLASDLRSVLRQRELPPLLSGAAKRGWLVHPDGRTERISMAA